MNLCTTRRFARAIAVVALVVAASRASAAEPEGTPTSRDALALCRRAKEAPAPQNEALLDQAIARADRAIAEDDRDPLAYFARFCALGEQARLSGIGLTSLFKLSAIRAAVDRTLELAPDFPDALLGKGSFLMSVPRLLGGDAQEGERLIRRALDIAPDYYGARIALSDALADLGRPAEARAEAERALAIAERRGDAEDIAEAQRRIDALTRHPSPGSEPTPPPR